VRKRKWISKKISKKLMKKILIEVNIDLKFGSIEAYLKHLQKNRKIIKKFEKVRCYWNRLIKIEIWLYYNNNNKAHFKSGMIRFISSEVIIITRQYCNYNLLYSLAPSKIITSKRRDQSSTYVYVALFTTIFMHNV